MSAVVLFQCGEEACAIRGGRVAQIAPLPLLSRPPTTPPVVAGFMNLAGRAAAVIDAARLFGVEEQAVDPLYKHILVLSFGSEALGLLVRRANDVRSVALNALRPVGDDASFNGCVEGDFDLDGRNVHLLDADRIFTAAERTQIEGLRLEEQRRLDQWAAP